MACTPKRKTSRREYETPRRSRFRAYLEEGYSTSRAAHLAKVPRSTARGWISTGDRRPGKERPGRPLIISDEKMKEITEWMTGHFDRRAMPLHQIAEVFDIKATDRTLLNAFARHGYHYHIPDCKPFLLDEQRLKRWSFLIANWDRTKEYWQRGLYYDETTVQSTLRRRLKILRKRGERRRLDCIQFKFQSGRTSIHCAAVIGYNFKIRRTDLAGPLRRYL
ncbi:hypothetical protein F5882DRAFT_417734 [Hyaloscypha sp. PMI_1271]|nr:hypothetical protein F5882DRAFT_417734 [Hyaloscypha sp. PMI_1271]